MGKAKRSGVGRQTELWYRSAALSAAVVAAFTIAVGVSAQGQVLAPAARFGTWGIDLTARDLRVRPGDSFYDYANGGWYGRTEIASDQMTVGPATDVRERIKLQLRALIEDTSVPASEAGSKVRNLYRSFMDEARLESLDDRPLRADLMDLAKVQTKAELAARMGASQHGFGTSIFKLSVTFDPKDPNRYAVEADVEGMGLPDRDFYLDARFAAPKAAYGEYVASTLEMVGFPDPKAAAGAVLAFESRLAEASWTRAERRDPNKSYHPVSLAQLQTLTEAFPWQPFLRGLDAPKLDRVIVKQLTAFPKIAAIYGETPLETLKAWQTFHTVHQAAPYLSRRFVDQRFQANKRLGGPQQQLPRWSRGVAAVDANLGDALGREYVRRHFSAQAKMKMQHLVANLLQAMHGRLEAADWLSASSKAEALKKLSLQRVMVGYPDRWRNYSALRVQSNDLYGNMRRAKSFSTRYNFARLQRPVQKGDWWSFTPQTLDAAFNQIRNEMVFPAAMLQPPFFDQSADSAVNYGAVGAVIGHEITHAFDDKGRNFDSSGRLRDWWTAADAQTFTDRSRALAAQYDAFEVAPGAKVNGSLTLGENIADQGGVALALDAYRLSLRGASAPVIDGYSGDQRLFLGWAQAWRAKAREAAVRAQLATDPHSPPRFRVDGVVRNLDAWYSAFDVRPADKLYVAPGQRVRVW